MDTTDPDGRRPEPIVSRNTERALRRLRDRCQRNLERQQGRHAKAMQDYMSSPQGGDEERRAHAKKIAAASEELLVRWGAAVRALDEVLSLQPPEQPALFDGEAQGEAQQETGHGEAEEAEAEGPQEEAAGSAGAAETD